MNKSDYNSNFKTKVSRSLTDLQNSLDEACRLGLPPNLGDQLYEKNELYFNDEIYNFQNDLTYKYASNNLEQFIAKHEELTYNNESTGGTGPKIINYNTKNNSSLSIRQTYIDTLRSLAQSKSALPKSQSHDALASSKTFFSKTDAKNQVLLIKKNEALEYEIRNLRDKLNTMEEEMVGLKNIAFRDAVSPGSMDIRTSFLESSGNNREPSPTLYDELKMRIDKYKNREIDLLNQLNEAINTIEDAKQEEMQAILRSEQLKEEFENMKSRFQSVIDENQKKLQNHSVLEEKYFQESIRKLNNDLTDALNELGIKTRTISSYEDQIKGLKSEVERLNLMIETLENEKIHIVDDLTTSVTKAVLQRDESVGHTTRIQNSLDREKSKHFQEKSILEEEMNELRNRLNTCENAQIHLSEEKIELLNKNSQLKSEMDMMKHSLVAQNKRIQHEMESEHEVLKAQILVLQQELFKKQESYENLIKEAEIIMRHQMSLTNKFKSEYGSNIHDMDRFVDRHHEEIGLLQNKLERCLEEVNLINEQNREYQRTLNEYTETMDSLRLLNRNLEEKRNNQDKEIMENLTIRNNLMKKVEMLSMQLQDLRLRISNCICGAFDLGDLLKCKTFEDIKKFSD